jgi:hypothetical protein
MYDFLRGESCSRSRPGTEKICMCSLASTIGRIDFGYISLSNSLAPRLVTVCLVLFSASLLESLEAVATSSSRARGTVQSLVTWPGASNS